MDEARDPFIRSILETADEFVACVPWGRWRAVLVHRRQHAGRTWLRMHTWNRHRKKLCWYPTKRFFVVPLADAAGLAGAILAGVNGRFEQKPKWLVEREEEELNIESPRKRPRRQSVTT